VESEVSPQAQAVVDRDANNTEREFQESMTAAYRKGTEAENEANLNDAGFIKPVVASDRLVVHAMADRRVGLSIGTRKEPRTFTLVIRDGLTMVALQQAIDQETTLEALAAELKKHPSYGQDIMITTGPGAVDEATATKFMKMAQRAAQKREVRMTGAPERRDE